MDVHFSTSTTDFPSDSSSRLVRHPANLRSHKPCVSSAMRSKRQMNGCLGLGGTRCLAHIIAANCMAGFAHRVVWIFAHYPDGQKCSKVCEQTLNTWRGLRCDLHIVMCCRLAHSNQTWARVVGSLCLKHSPEPARNPFWRMQGRLQQSPKPCLFNPKYLTLPQTPALTMRSTAFCKKVGNYTCKILFYVLELEVTIVCKYKHLMS